MIRRQPGIRQGGRIRTPRVRSGKRLAAAGGLALGATLGAGSAQAADFTVTKLADTDGTCTAGDCSLREAIAAANSTPAADRILFASGLSGTITLGLGQLSISEPLEISGPGAPTLAVSGNNASRIFNVNRAGEATIAGLTLRDGNSGNSSGAAINNTGTHLTVRESTISGNTAGLVGAGVRSGRAQAAYSPDPGPTSVTIESSTISGGSASSGGGVSLSGNLPQPLTIDSSTISGNLANLNGGGIDLTGAAEMTITSSTITGNTAVRRGGGIRATGESRELRNTIVAGNTAETGPDLEGSAFDLAFSLIGDRSGVRIARQEETLFDVDPRLGPLASNGGPTQTHALPQGSPAVDQGNAFGASADQRGLPRPFDHPEIGNAECGDGSDIGAFELQPPGEPGDPPGDPGDPGAGRNLPAQLAVSRAQVRNNRLRAAGTLDRAAAGDRVVLRYRAGGRQIRLRATIGQNGCFEVNRQLRGPQRRANAGQLSIRYAGNQVLRAARARIRAARGAVRLRFNRNQPRLRGNRVQVAGQVNRRARGRVQIAVQFNRPNGRPGEVTAEARVNRRGRFSETVRVPGVVRNQGAYVAATHRGRGRLGGQIIGRSLGPG